MVKIIGVRFKKACKVYDFDSNDLDLNPGETVIVEVEKGLGLGTAVSRPREVDPAALTRPLKKVVRKADAVDLERNGFNTERENEAFRICREKIVHYKLPMKLIRVEYLFDSSKAIFYFTSDTRVDFRELVKDLASGFHTRIEMRQIGVRDEAKMIGGLGPCGRELCCSGFLSDFEPVTIKMAKEQNLALNPVKISGICGRLMCCLSYEHLMYQEEKQRNKAAAAAAATEGGCGGCHAHAQEGEAAEKPQEQVAAEAKPQPRAQQPQQQQQRQGGRGPGNQGRENRENRDNRDNRDNKDQGNREGKRHGRHRHHDKRDRDRARNAAPGGGAAQAATGPVKEATTAKEAPAASEAPAQTEKKVTQEGA